MTNADLELAPQIVLSRLLGEPAEEIIAELERISQVADARRQHLREQKPSSPMAWPGETTTVVIAPSTFLSDLLPARDLVDEIANKARTSGIHLHLIADGEEIIPGSGEYPIYYYGSPTLRVLASPRENPVVTFTSMTEEEMLKTVSGK